MVLHERVPRQDHNFLSGYALLSLAAVQHSPALTNENRETIKTILDTAKDLTRHYANDQGQCNWYHGKLSRCAAPPEFDWDGVVLCLCQDVDDTSVAAQLRRLCSLDMDRAVTIDQFASIALKKGEAAALGYRSRRRLELAEVDANVYQTWFLPGPDPTTVCRTASLSLPVRMVPRINSVELVTSANIWAAVWMMGGHKDLQPSQQATSRFVNRLTQWAVRQALNGDQSGLRFVAPYYPWVPLAPLAFLVRDHTLGGAMLLDPTSLQLIVQAYQNDELCGGRADSPFPALAYALNCAGWCSRAGCFTSVCKARVAALWRALNESVDCSLPWPDFTFFNDAHIGNYSGSAYSQALMVETLTLLLEALG